MFRNYLKTAFRNLRRSKGFVVINVAGLAVGIAVCLMIFLIIRFEQSFDQFHSKKDRIFRVLTQFQNADGVDYSQGVPFPLPRAIRNDLGDVKTSAIYTSDDVQMAVINEQTGLVQKKFKEEKGVFFLEPSFFEIFDFPLLAGDWKALDNPNTALISKETAERYFGNWHTAMGKTLKRNNTQELTIAGVLAPIPKNTDFQIRIAASYATIRGFNESDDWVSVNGSHGCYILLPQGMAAADINRRLLQMTRKYKPAEHAKTLQVAQAVSEVHSAKGVRNYLGRVISKEMLQAMWMIAAFILLIACVNFINLATAQAVNRAKEIGVRKVLGGTRRQLCFQFFNETAIITLAAVVLAVLLVIAALPAMAGILQLPLSPDMLQQKEVVLLLAVLYVIVVLLAGFYPALVVSRFNPITALKSKIATPGFGGISMRRCLVVVQFVIAQALIIGTLISVKQMDFFRNHPLGFAKDAIATIDFPSDSAGRAKLDYLKNKLQAVRGIKHVSFSFTSPASDGNWQTNFRFDKAPQPTTFDAYLKWADADFLKTYNIQLAAGRNVQPSDTVREFLVNETLLHRLGITDPSQGLNKEIEIWDGEYKGLVVGVVKDFNATSLRETIAPVLISTDRDSYSTASISFDPTLLVPALKETERLWNEVYPEFVFEQRFVDTVIESFYHEENQLSNLYKIFAVLAIFLSCLGLYGLASFMAVQRIREVGIRKVLGASMHSIVLLFSKEFLLLIGIAFVIAAPVAWYFMHQWLQEFAYRTPVSIWIFIGGALIALLVALGTISSQAIKAAMIDPIRNLRSE